MTIGEERLGFWSKVAIAEGVICLGMLGIGVLLGL